jgi:hypothetical protein
VRWRLLAILLVLIPTSAAAHTSSVSYSHLRLAPGSIEYDVKLSTRDLYEALGLEKDRDPTDAEIVAGEGRLVEYVSGRLAFTAGGRPCQLQPRGVRILSQTDRFVELRFGVRCPKGGEKLSLRYDLFFDLDPRHTSRLQLTRGERTITQQDLSKPTEQDPGANRHEWELGAGFHDAAKGHLSWIGEGMTHIYTGYDHIAFLVGLLLVATIRRRAPAGPPDSPWEARGLREGVLHLAKIVTAFTVAHSLTLIAAALDWVTLPGRFVESAIAASIVYVAVENIWLGDPRHRWPLTFCFGLIHGFGFAGVLRPMLPPSGVIIPLLELNLGVELGQLSIVLVLYPILHLITRTSAQTYRRTVVLCGSILIGLFGAIWLFERIMGVELISQYL